MEREDIREWVESNASGLMPGTAFTPDEIDHMAMCMDFIRRWYYHNYQLDDPFLVALLSNDFSEACFQADSTNRKGLYLYALFLANKLPMDYRNKAAKGGSQ